MTNQITVTAHNKGTHLIYICDQTSQPYANLAQLERIFSSVSKTTLHRRVGDVPKADTKTASIRSGNRSYDVPLYPASVVYDLAFEFDPGLAKQIGGAGAAVYLYGLAGYEVKPQEKQQEKPRLKIAPKKLSASSEMKLLKQMLDFIPGLDERMKAATMLGHVMKSHPEAEAAAKTAIAALPAVAATEKTFTPTEIGRMLDPIATARIVNVRLIEAGLQESYRTANDRLKYKATEQGATHSVLTVESKANGDPTESLRWKESVVELLSIRAVK